MRYHPGSAVRSEIELRTVTKMINSIYRNLFRTVSNEGTPVWNVVLPLENWVWVGNFGISVFLSIPDFFNRRLIHFRVSSSSCLSALSNSASIWAFARHFAISSSVLKPFLSQKLQKTIIFDRNFHNENLKYLKNNQKSDLLNVWIIDKLAWVRIWNYTVLRCVNILTIFLSQSK